MSNLNNSFKLLDLLLSHGKLNNEEIADLLGVSPRMIRNYINELRKNNISIKTIRGKNGGFMLDHIQSCPVCHQSLKKRIAYEQLKKDTQKILNKRLSFNSGNYYIDDKFISNSQNDVYRYLLGLTHESM